MRKKQNYFPNTVVQKKGRVWFVKSSLCFVLLFQRVVAHQGSFNIAFVQTVFLESINVGTTYPFIPSQANI